MTMPTMNAITTGETTGEIRAHARALKADLVTARSGFMDLADWCGVEGAKLPVGLGALDVRQHGSAASAMSRAQLVLLVAVLAVDVALRWWSRFVACDCHRSPAYLWSAQTRARPA